MPPNQRRPVIRSVMLVALAPLILPGCSELLSESSAAGAGLGGAAIADAAGAGATATTGIGLGVQAGVRAGLHYAQRRAHGAEQDSIARAAGPLGVGELASWSIAHDVPIEPDERGEVTVARVIEAGPIRCKEIIFSVDATTRPEEKPRRGFYTAYVCQDGQDWRWASAEPATERWGSLQ
ncbi:hypothetical protein [Roseomonas elaeocarpi]|uniref:Lipoprotein n=1 Tax=Roseomonas elaeocarpi TaxID=907779 RepID=A0ABV6JLL2_9PROT